MFALLPPPSGERGFFISKNYEFLTILPSPDIAAGLIGKQIYQHMPSSLSVRLSHKDKVKIAVFDSQTRILVICFFKGEEE